MLENLIKQREILKLENITKAFPGVLANDRININLLEGEIHAILGENGAGKTTLMNILYGLYNADEGKIYLDGTPIEIHSPKDAINKGIGMVHQHFMLILQLTIMENIILGKETAKGGILDMNSAEKVVKQYSEKFGLHVNPKAKIMDTSVGIQQRVEILKALYHGANILVLDEPTSVLTPQEVVELFKVIKSLTAKGMSVFFITHKLEEVVAISDRVTVVRDGRVVDTRKTKDTNKVELARMMVGRDVVLTVTKDKVEKGDVVLNIKNLEALDYRNLRAINGVNIQVREGEIVGIAGVAGNGQAELEEVLSGLRKAHKGNIYFKDKDITHISTRDRLRMGISHISQDRLGRGLIVDFNITENIILGDHDRKPYANGLILNFTSILNETEKLIGEFDIRTPSPFLPVHSLSGGNQQKLIVAREFNREPDLLIANQPTRGLDVGAIEFVHNQLLRFRREKKAILLISLELEEIMSLSDRILVIYEGEIIKEFKSSEATKELVGYYMMGGEKKKINHEEMRA